MSIDLKLEVKNKFVPKKFRLPKGLVAEFELYVEAARETEPSADQNAVLQAILVRQFSKDKAFQDWKSRRTAPRASSTRNPDRPPPSDVLDQRDETSPGVQLR